MSGKKRGQTFFAVSVFIAIGELGSDIGDKEAAV